MKWITRERPKIDRIACPWLIARFIDETPDFLYVPAADVVRIANESERLALRMLTTGTHDQHTQHPTATTAPRAEATAVPKPTETETAEQSPGADSARGTRRGGFLRRLFTD